jgi:hypothetical protein
MGLAWGKHGRDEKCLEELVGNSKKMEYFLTSWTTTSSVPWSQIGNVFGFMQEMVHIAKNIEMNRLRKPIIHLQFNQVLKVEVEIFM